MKLSKALIVTAAFTACIGMLPAQDKGQQTEPKVPEDFRLGIIFSTPSILLDIESYEGGIGIKQSYADRAVRWSADLFYAHTSNLLSINMLRAQELHLTGFSFEKFAISPYYGWFVSGGLIWQRLPIDPDNGTNDFTLPLSGGPILGAELFLFPFLSVFAEYQLAVDFDVSLTRVKSAGTATNTWSLNVLVDSKMGNSSRLGIVLYLPEGSFKKKAGAPES